MDIARVEQLGENLDRACKQFDLWATEQVGAHEALKKHHLRVVNELHGEISELERREKLAKKRKSEINRRVENERQELAELKSGVDRLERRQTGLPDRRDKVLAAIDNLAVEIDEHRSRLSEAASIKDTALSASSSDIQMYERYLGLTIEVDGRYLIFTFTRIDPDDHARAFRVDLELCDDPSGSHRVVACQPDVGDLSSAVADLNSTADVGTFVRGMRKRFIESCHRRRG